MADNLRDDGVELVDTVTCGCGTEVKFYVTAVRPDADEYSIECYHGETHLKGWSMYGYMNTTSAEWGSFMMGSITGELVKARLGECAEWWYRVAKSGMSS
jgi:hypothetical protein